jgi:hypothetical protein
MNSHWLMERPDMVTAKGKGLMQTYWCEPSTVRENPTNQIQARIEM